jgi:hypothetical protein
LRNPEKVHTYAPGVTVGAGNRARGATKTLSAGIKNNQISSKIKEEPTSLATSQVVKIETLVKDEDIQIITQSPEAVA